MKNKKLLAITLCIIAAGIVTIVFWFFCKVKNQHTYNASDAVFFWDNYARHHTADEAEKAFVQIEPDLLRHKESLSVFDRCDPYFRLSAKYGAEGNYAKSLDFYMRGARYRETADKDRWEPWLGYVAALAGRADWFDRPIVPSEYTWWPLYSQACLAWIRQDYKAVVDIAFTTNWSEKPDDATEWVYWLIILKYKSQIKLHDYHQFLGETWPRATMKVSSPNWLLKHMMLQVVLMTEEAGDLNEALKCAFSAKPHFIECMDLSDGVMAVELSDIVKRIRAKLAAQGQSSSSLDLPPFSAGIQVRVPMPCVCCEG